MSKSGIQQVIRNGLMMRKSFDFTKYTFTKWFPGHMSKGINQVHRKLKQVDCVIEVHDARIPISGRNPLFEKEIGEIKPHILIFNKVDLIDENEIKNIIQYYQKQGNSEICFTNCKNQKDKGIKIMTQRIVSVIKESNRYHRALNNDYSVMILGIPNVGKSSLINSLRVKNLHKGRATAVGALPGVTKSVLERIKICDDPLIYVMDTPGILTPKFSTVEDGLKLALVNTMKDHLVGEDIIADYLLYRLNCEGNHEYVDFLKLDHPTDNIQEVLVVHAIKNNMTLKLRRYVAEGGLDIAPDTLRAAKNFIQAYRTGQFGHLRLDSLDSSNDYYKN